MFNCAFHSQMLRSRRLAVKLDVNCCAFALCLSVAYQPASICVGGSGFLNRAEVKVGRFTHVFEATVERCMADVCDPGHCIKTAWLAGIPHYNLFLPSGCQEAHTLDLTAAPQTQVLFQHCQCRQRGQVHDVRAICGLQPSQSRQCWERSCIHQSCALP